MGFATNALGIVRIVLVMTALSLMLFSYKRGLVPAYGSVPALRYLNYVFMGSMILPVPLPKLSTMNNILILGILACLEPNAVYYVGAYTARQQDPFWGPIATHVAVLAPIVFIASSAVLSVQLSNQDSETSVMTNRFIILQAFYAVTTACADYLWPMVSPPEVSDSRILLTTGGSMIAIWALINVLSLADLPKLEPEATVQKEPALSSNKGGKAKKNKTTTEFALPPPPPPKMTTAQSLLQPRIIICGLLLPLLPVVLPYLSSPVLPYPLQRPYTHPTHPLRILSSVPSLTGRIVVGEMLPTDDGEMVSSSRFLRASHSLLGGVWMGQKAAYKSSVPVNKDERGEPLGDSIYSTFVLQEATRLVSSTKKGKEGKYEKALIIGLGTGISATALQQHRLETTVIEIDPAVYNASRDYFGLNVDPSNVYLEDARRWVERRQNTGELFDIVIHDCFSGGGVPQHLFTVQFWDALKKSLHPEGVIAVNFAGRLGSDSSRSILLTLQQSFGRCRAFHDSNDELLTEDRYTTDFINMVLFCTPSSEPLTFRPPRESDYLDSYLREHVLGSLPRREVDVSLIIGAAAEPYEQWILTDQNNRLGKWQDDEAFVHWKVIREVLPDWVWETY